MKKILIIVFSILAVLVLIFFVWNLIFGGTMLPNLWNTVIEPVNNLWKDITGSSNNLISEATAETADETVGW